MITSSRWAATRFWPHTFSPAYMTSCISEVEVSLIFEAPTVAEMAHHLETLDPDRPRAATSSAIVRVPREGTAPASIAQERLWKLQQALPGLPFFNVLYALRLTSPVDVAVLERSINEIVRRHEILRTTFAVVDGRHVQVIAPQLTVPLLFDDLRSGAKIQKGSRRSPTRSRRGASFLRSRARSPVRARLVRIGRAGTPLAHHHAPGRRATAGRSACSSANCPRCTTPSAPERRRRLRRSQFNMRTLHPGSDTGGHIRTSLRSSPTGGSSFATHCP